MPFQVGCRLRVRLEFGCLEEDACCFAVTFRAGEKVSASGMKCGELPAVGGEGGKYFKPCLRTGDSPNDRGVGDMRPGGERDRYKGACQNLERLPIDRPPVYP